MDFFYFDRKHKILGLGWLRKFASYVIVETNERRVLLDGSFPPLVISRLFIFVESRVRRGFKGYITGRRDFNPGQERVEITPFDGGVISRKVV